MQKGPPWFPSPFYDPNAISHQDFVAEFADTAFMVPGTSIEINGHDNPLGIGVDFQTFNWEFSFANFFVILNFNIKNIGDKTLEDVHLGYWMDGVVRNVNITPAGSGGGDFYNKGGNGYMDSLYMAMEWDAAGDLGFTESFMGLKFLGADDKNGFRHPAVDSTIFDHYNTWTFLSSADPLLFFPTNDNQRFDKMAQGLNRADSTILDWPALQEELKSPSNRSSLISVGSFDTLAPGDSIQIAFAIVCAKKNGDGPGIEGTPEEFENFINNAGWAQTAFNGEDANFNGILEPEEDLDGDGVLDRFILPTPPDPPVTKVFPTDNSIEVYWTDTSEFSIDPISKTIDFEGYRIYKTSTQFDIQDLVDVQNDLKLVEAWDNPANSLFFDTGFESIRLEEPVTFEGDSNLYWYHYSFENVVNGWQHAVSVTAFDQGDETNNLQSLESGLLSNMKRVFPGKPANDGFENGDPFVYPNPYYGSASWEGPSTFEEDRKIIFANLPARCNVRIYTVSGDLVDNFDHNNEYSGDDIRWYETYSDSEVTAFSGGEHAWDLLSADNQIIARGIYLFTVVDLESEKSFKGKFVVIK